MWEIAKQDGFQHTAARRRLDLIKKAVVIYAGFNTQPPEGGWLKRGDNVCFWAGFNTQPPEGGW